MTSVGRVEHNFQKIKNQFEHDLQKAVSDFSFLNDQNKSPTDAWQRECITAHAYPIAAGGKRVRPLLLLLTANSLAGEGALSLAKWPAVALECVHTYSLVHDDLPCMDNDDLRRGQPTTHKVYGDAKALLVGDGLLTGAFACLANLPPEHGQLLQACVSRLAKAAGAQGMVLGQWMDLTATATSDMVAWDDVARLHHLKTGELFAASFVMGAMCAQSLKQKPLSENSEQWAEIGYKIGLAFQIIDDVLDETKPSSTLGKTAGKDAAQHKLTAVKLLGLQQASALAQKLSTEAAVTLNKLLPVDTDTTILLKTFVNQLLERKF